MCNEYCCCYTGVRSSVPLVRVDLSLPFTTPCRCVYQATCVCPVAVGWRSGRSCAARASGLQLLSLAGVRLRSTYKLYVFTFHLQEREKIIWINMWESLTAAFKYNSSRPGLKYVLVHSLLSRCVEVVEKLDGAELECVGYWCSSNQRASRCQGGCNLHLLAVVRLNLILHLLRFFDLVFVVSWFHVGYWLFFSLLANLAYPPFHRSLW